MNIYGLNLFNFEISLAFTIIFMKNKAKTPQIDIAVLLTHTILRG